MAKSLVAESLDGNLNALFDLFLGKAISRSGWAIMVDFASAQWHGGQRTSVT